MIPPLGTGDSSLGSTQRDAQPSTCQGGRYGGGGCPLGSRLSGYTSSLLCLACFESAIQAAC